MLDLSHRWCRCFGARTDLSLRFGRYGLVGLACLNLIPRQSEPGDQRRHVDHASAAIEPGHDLPTTNLLVNVRLAESDKGRRLTGTAPKAFSEWNSRHIVFSLSASHDDALSTIILRDFLRSDLGISNAKISPASFPKQARGMKKEGPGALDSHFS